MKNSIKLSDFSFQFSGYGHYKVTYTSPVSGKSWTATTSNMSLIDATKNVDDVKKVELERLKRVCKYAQAIPFGTFGTKGKYFNLRN